MQGGGELGSGKRGAGIRKEGSWDQERGQLGSGRRGAEIRKEGSWDPGVPVPAPGCCRAGLRAHSASALPQATLVPDRARHRQLRDVPGLRLHHLQVRARPGSLPIPGGIPTLLRPAGSWRGSGSEVRGDGAGEGGDLPAPISCPCGHEGLQGLTLSTLDHERRHSFPSVAPPL